MFIHQGGRAIAADFGRETGYILGRLPNCSRANKDKQPLTLPFSSTGNVGYLVDLIGRSLDWGEHANSAVEGPVDPEPSCC